MKAWEQDRLQLLAQLLHDERKAEATKWRYPPTQTYAHCRQAAYDFLAESQLHAWLQRQNLEAGLAPTSEELVTEYARLSPHAGVPGIRNTALFVFAQKATFKRKWAQRWRRRWKVSHRKLKILPPLSAEGCDKQSHVWSPFLIFSDPTVGPPKHRTLLRGPKSGVQKRHPKRRPQHIFAQAIAYFS